MRPSALRRWRSWLASSVWAITADAFTTLWSGDPLPARMETTLLAGSAGELAGLGGRGSTGQTAVAPQIAVMSLHGAMVTRHSRSDSGENFLSYELIGAALQSVIGREDVGAILLDMNTPGGHVAGCSELAQQIRIWSQQKPIVALASPLMASAGLWIGSAATEVVATPTASVGSLGVLAQHVDLSRLMKNWGIKITTFESVPHKAEGQPYAPLSAEAKAEFQRRVDELHAKFADAIAAYRGRSRAQIDADFGRGRTLFSEQALRVGMIDRIATLDAVVAGLRTRLSAAPAGSFATAQAAPGGLLLASTSVVAAHQPAPPVSPRVEFVTMEITAELRAALESAGFVQQGASDDACRVACNTFCRSRGWGVPTVAAAMVAMLAAASAPPAPPATQTPAAATPATPVPQQTAPAVGQTPVAATPAPAQIAAVAAPLQAVTSPERPTERDLFAQVQLTGLADAQQMALIRQFTPQLGQMTHASLVTAINQQLTTLRAPAGASIAVTADEQDRFHAEARDQILGRALSGVNTITWRDPLSDQERTWTRGRHSALASLPRIIERAFVMQGVSPGLAADLATSPVRLTAVLSGNGSSLGISAQAATNVRAMYQNIFLDAANVILRRSYDRTVTTFERWCRRDEDFRDFKPRNSVILGELPSPKAIPENGEFEETQTVDGKETWSVTVWGLGFSQSWQMTVDDNLGAFNATNQKMAAAMKRKQNALMYNILKSNRVLSDGTGLFGTRNSVANTRTGYAAPSHDSLTLAYKAFAEKKGLNTEAAVTLNLTPAGLLVPPALRESALTLLGSMSKPGQSNANVTNIYQNELDVVVDAELGAGADGGSDTTHYVYTDASQADSLVYAYLNGTESPVIESMNSFDTLGVRYRMYQVFGGTALDHRGIERFQS